VTGRQVLFGVDVVDLARVTRAVDYGGTTYLRHVNARDEPCLHEDPCLAAAASVGIKECLVKALGGRPPGFSWHDFVATGAQAPDWVGSLLAAAVPELESTTDIPLTHRCAYALRGASGRAARARFDGAGTEDDVRAGRSPVAAARWGWRGDLVIAIAVLTTIAEGEPR